MELSTEQLSKLQALLSKRIWKTIGAIVAVATTGSSLYLAKDPTTRILLLSVEVLGMSWLWLFLRVSLLQKRIEKLEAGPSETLGAQSQANTRLTENEFSVLCMVCDDVVGGGSLRKDIRDRLGLDWDDIDEICEELLGRGLIERGRDHQNMVFIDFIATRAGRRLVKERRKSFVKT